MTLRIFATLVSVLLSVCSIAQPVDLTVKWKAVKNRPNGDTIYYDVSRKLKWSDFQGKPVAEHTAGAITAGGFGYQSLATIRDDKISVTVEIFVYFDKNRSWKKENIHSDYHLAHEQRHFDITRLGAQHFFELLKRAAMTVKNYQQKIPELFDQAYGQSRALQNQYDRETNHSIDIEQQMLWNQRIEKQILALPKTGKPHS